MGTQLKGMRSGRMRSWPNFSYYPRIFFEALKQSKRYLRTARASGTGDEFGKVNLSDLVMGSVARSCVYGNKLSGSIKHGDL
jgi:hypothetical protein